MVTGRVGLYRDATDIRKAEPWGESAFWTKIPASSRNGARGLAMAPRVVRFLPCQDRATTAWPGGLALADRRGVTLQVQVDGRPWRALSIPVRG